MYACAAKEYMGIPPQQASCSPNAGPASGKGAFVNDRTFFKGHIFKYSEQTKKQA
jgi:hypothetical protein